MNVEKLQSVPQSALVRVRPEDVVHVWPYAEKWIEAANTKGHGRWTPYDWMVKAVTGVAEMYVGNTERFVLFGEIFTWPRKREYVVTLFGGEGDHDYAAIDRALGPIARSHGCDAIQLAGRPGWRNALKALDYSLDYCSWSKELSDA